MTPFDAVGPVLARFRTAPTPRGEGRTRHNLGVLAAAAAEDLDVARLAEAHLDATTILAELDGPAPSPGSCWGVWAAESGPDAVRVAEGRLSGRKPFCSGAAGPCTHALVTAEGGRLFAIDLAGPGVTVHAGEWQALGMRGSAAATVDLDAVPATEIGAPGAYLERPGFWHGAIAVAAAWFGGASGVAAPLRRAGRDGRLDAHGLAHLGAVDAALAAARAVLRDAAATLDEQEPAAWDAERRRALRVRAVVETAVEGALQRTGRALGPAPVARDAAHARRVADLEVYVRQSHAERDLATLGELAGADDADPLS
ncbi:acyl-CoA dehydrogenase [Actinomycetospora lutea]|uniref:acyl-CoA dehydrogenase n=1 Tax=Actinomycetospora lutea TaxID=663604 RepID=UPI002366F3F4|nr:acyl-CoA dehydrogenase [Actinomycetospora lutea]MDD7940307.1 acyl-CoA dehydrogenase [Actinomycetospora lutea]